MRFPVAAKIALTRAGAKGGTPGSPTPLGGLSASAGTLCTLVTRVARERLSKHLLKRYIEGEKDEHRLTVHGLSYLRHLDRAIDSRN